MASVRSVSRISTEGGEGRSPEEVTVQLSSEGKVGVPQSGERGRSLSKAWWWEGAWRVNAWDPERGVWQECPGGEVWHQAGTCLKGPGDGRLCSR